MGVKLGLTLMKHHRLCFEESAEENT